MKPDDTGVRAAALLALDSGQRQRLKAYALILAKNSRDSDEDLLQTAHVRWLTSDVPVVGPEDTTNFLAAAMKSRAFNLRRRQRLERAVHGDRVVQLDLDDEDPINLATDDTASDEDTIFAQELYDLFATDEEVQTFIMYRADGAERAEIMEETGWDEKKYEAVRKRKLRMVAQMKTEGKVP